MSIEIEFKPTSFAGRLTEREKEVLALVKDGYPDPEVADLLMVSVFTVRAHMRNVYNKIGSCVPTRYSKVTRGDLIRWLLETNFPSD